MKDYRYYYSQAAGSGKEENPFLTDDADALSGEKSSRNGHSRVAGPPARPPPPHTKNINNFASKSAFDDLNDTIRVALSGSPLKSSTVGGLGVVEGQQQNVAGIFSSNFQQHAFAPSQQQSQMYSSPVKGNVHNVSSTGGGSQY